ncbi:MAG: ferrous iron transport protein A [Oscillospiraceae bacterium]|jgi:ferrous iron transport protein A|nr:ferrous iron transport protein A [Oscillospiraceae bacterium]
MKHKEISLDKLPVGQKASVTALKADGMTRRRILDLGVVRGTEIESLYKSPSGNPVAYQIRGAVIALRTDVSKRILVTA